MLSVGSRIRYYWACIGGFLWLSLNINITPFRAITTIRYTCVYVCLSLPKRKIMSRSNALNAQLWT
jgi:hypothetical protein